MQPLFPCVGPRPPPLIAVLPRGREITPSLGANVLSEGLKKLRASSQTAISRCQNRTLPTLAHSQVVTGPY